MIPISLTIEGLYSYQSRQTIDFTDLTEAGLFGIFGAVGSGKSSILEAITFALYGETERMNSRDNRNYNMMNLRSSRSYIDFEFLNHENKKYRITRSYRRNSKNYEDVKAADIVLYTWEEDKWIPLESAQVSDIIGLSYQNFKRTIIIPQGQFKEFLELGATDRTKMLKEIFNLQRFDLQARTATLYAENRSALDQQEGQLLAFEQVTAENILSKETQLQEEELLFREQERVCKAAEEQLQQLKHLKEDVELLQQKEQAWQQLEAQKPAKDALAGEVEGFERVQKEFAALLSNNEATSTELKQRQAQAGQEKARLEQLKQEQSLIRQRLDTLQTEMSSLPQKRIEEMELGFIGQLQGLSREVMQINERQKIGTAFVQTAQEKVKELKLQLVQEQEKLSALKVSRPNAARLLEVEKWWGQKENLDQRLSEAISKQEDLKAAEEQQLAALAGEGATRESYSADFEQQTVAIEAELHLLRQQQAHLQVQEQLAQYTHTLQDGIPCPLCGAVEHPEIAAIGDVSKELAGINTAIDRQNGLLKQLAAQRSKVEQIIVSLTALDAQKTEGATSIESLKTHIASHQQAFRWQDFDAAERTVFEQQKQQLEATENQILSLEATLTSTHEALNKEQENLDKANGRLEVLRIDLARNEAMIQQHENNIKQLDVADYRHYTVEAIAVLLQQLKESNDQLQADYEHSNRAFNEINPLIAAQESTCSATDSRIADLNTLLETQLQAIDQRLQAHQMSSVEQVKEILQKDLDIAAIRNALQAFRVQYEALQMGVAELKEKLKDKTFDREHFAAQEQALLQLQAELKQFATQIAQLKGMIQWEKSELEKKQVLITKLTATKSRAEQLNIMKKLFDRAGFVEYVSSIYLRQLCAMANVRFHRLTRNQLSLQLNDNNDFEIVDYLNDGRARSVKTLSGGQGFQASLSLALALAESVQSNARADKHFFFIDEGFGTQDAASVHIVFETLRHLQKENRIVGIISHVDELKDKIPVSLSVIKDEEQGSRIEVNLS